MIFPFYLALSVRGVSLVCYAFEVLSPLLALLALCGGVLSFFPLKLALCLLVWPRACLVWGNFEFLPVEAGLVFALWGFWVSSR